MDQPNAAQTPAHKNNVAMGVLCYLGILVIVSYIVAKDEPFVKFHIRQGLILLVIEALIWVVTNFFFWQFYMLWPLIDLLELAILVLSIVGIVNVVHGKEKPLPLVGSWGNSFPL